MTSFTFYIELVPDLGAQAKQLCAGVRGGAAAGEEDARRVRGQLQAGPAEDGQAGLHLVRGGLLPRGRGHREYQL